MIAAMNGHCYKYKFSIREHSSRKHPTTYSNNIFTASFTPEYIRVNYNIVNNSSSSIKIIWDKAYIVVQGDSSKVIPSTVSFENKDLPVPHSEMRAGQALEGFITPVDYIKNNGNKWLATDFYPEHDQSNSENTDWIMGLLGVDIFKLYLPVASNGKTEIYKFTFYPVEMEKSATSLEPKQ
ncbi:hypothetical protein A9P82_00760 [Arachidicoccus ginsenosidimutans]|nr:hypothetical protein A9P82_00760 [Arachidicoccus sp. BS20]